MSATYVSNLVINTYTDFSQIFFLNDSQSNAPLDLTGYSVSSQMRKTQSSKNNVTFTASILDPYTGQIQIGLTTSQTANIKPGRYIYDVVVINNQNITSRVVEGMVLVREGATH